MPPTVGFSSLSQPVKTTWLPAALGGTVAPSLMRVPDGSNQEGNCVSVTSDIRGESATWDGGRLELRSCAITSAPSATNQVGYLASATTAGNQQVCFRCHLAQYLIGRLKLVVSRSKTPSVSSPHP